MKQAFLRNDGLDWAVFDNLIGGYLDFLFKFAQLYVYMWNGFPCPHNHMLQNYCPFALGLILFWLSSFNYEV